MFGINYKGRPAMRQPPLVLILIYIA